MAVASHAMILLRAQKAAEVAAAATVEDPRR